MNDRRSERPMSEAPMVIASPANPRVKAVGRLRSRRERDATGLTIVDGAREIGRAIDAGVEVVEVFVCEPVAIGIEAGAVLQRLRPGGWTSVSDTVLARLAFGDRADGIVAVVRPPRIGLADLRLPGDPLVVVVEGIEKPGNLGAILRSVDGSGVDALIAADPVTDLFNPNAIRASLGTIFGRPVVQATAAETLDWLRAGEIRIVAARVDATTDYADADLRGPLAIVLGSEAAGLSDAWRATDVVAVRLPMLGLADSLNVSAAAAILCYEALRQRRSAAT
jgi:RNA methyltransferase, TrmH family